MEGSCFEPCSNPSRCSSSICHADQPCCAGALLYHMPSLGLYFTGVAANKTLANCCLSPFPSVRALEGRMASEICKSFPCTRPGAQRCSSVSMCPPTAHAVCAETCTVEGWDLVWELGVCFIPKPFPSFLYSQKTRKSHSWTCLSFASVHNLHGTSQSQPLLQMWLYTVYRSKLHREMLIKAFVEPHNVICVVFLSLCHWSALLMFSLKFSICRYALFHPNILFSLWPSWVSSPPAASPIVILNVRKPQVNPYGCLPY